MGFARHIILTSPTGAQLSVYHTASSIEPKAIVLICHGLAEHAGRYDRFAHFLALRGYHVFAHDHRGHGATRALDAPFGRFAWRNGVALVMDDVMAVRQHALACHPGLPVLLFGHSMGAMIATATAEAHPHAFAGLAIWNADLAPGIAGKAGSLLLKAERFFKGSDVPSTLAQKFTFDPWARSVPDAATDFDWLNRDHKEVEAYVADPLCGFAPSVSMWLDVLEFADTAGQTKNLRRLPPGMPIYLVGGGKDPATNGGKAVIRLSGTLRDIGMKAVSLTIFEDMRHETLNEFGREDAMKAFAAWADGAAASVSRG